MNASDQGGPIGRSSSYFLWDSSSATGNVWDDRGYVVGTGPGASLLGNPTPDTRAVVAAERTRANCHSVLRSHSPVGTARRKNARRLPLLSHVHTRGCGHFPTGDERLNWVLKHTGSR
jgi:hypothetical protein